MLRIGSGQSAIDLTIQSNLAKSFNDLNRASERLSTLKRINRGSDDPAGLIAAEALRSELVSLNQAVENTHRASSLVRVADSGLSQVSGLLNTIRGNVLAAASVTTSPAEAAALQLETDAALEALNRIGNVTSFNGRNLLDGSGGFQVSGVDSSQLADVQVHDRSGDSSTTVEVNVQEAAGAAELVIAVGDAGLAEDTALLIQGSDGAASVQIAAGATSEQVAQAIATVSESVGVSVTVEEGEVIVSSNDVGSAATVSVEVIEGSVDVGTGSAEGTDAIATVNGLEVSAEGNVLQVRTESLEANITIAAGFTGTADAFTVGGSALSFALSASPSNLSRISLPRINSATLGGAAGSLNELRSGGAASLSSGNLAHTMELLDAASSQVTAARARAGAFERFSVDSSRNVLNRTIENISSALSQIEDADIAVESARLVRSLILIDAGVSSARFASASKSAAAQLLAPDLFATGR